MTAPTGTVVLGYHPVTRRVTSLALPNGISQSMAYDGAGRVQSMQQQSVGGSDNFNYSYDGNGRISTLTGSDHALAYQYDSAGRLNSEVRTGAGAYSRNFGFDASNNITRHTTASVNTNVLNFNDSTMPAAAEIVSGSWAVSNGQLSGSGQLRLNVEASSYYSVKVTLDGANVQPGQETAAGVYLGESESGRTRIELVETNKNGSLTCKLREVWVPVNGPSVTLQETAEVAFDGQQKTLMLHRLAGVWSVRVAGTNLVELQTTLALSPTGNVGLEAGSLAATFDDFMWQTVLPEASVSHQFNAINQRLEDGVSYDNAGNLLTENKNGVQQSYTYDRLNRLKTATIGGNVSSYDYYGGSWMRSGLTLNGSTTNYVYDGFACVAQVSGGSTTHYGVPFSKPMWESAGGVTTAYLNDGRNNVGGLISTTGVQARLNYNAHGEVTGTDAGGNSQAVSSGPRYGGELFDAHTSQVYLRNRQYDAGSGSFNTADPTGYNGGSNLYGYCGGDPVNNADPMGTTVTVNGRVFGKGTYPTIFNGSPALDRIVTAMIDSDENFGNFNSWQEVSKYLSNDENRDLTLAWISIRGGNAPKQGSSTNATTATTLPISLIVGNGTRTTIQGVTATEVGGAGLITASILSGIARGGDLDYPGERPGWIFRPIELKSGRSNYGNSDIGTILAKAEGIYDPTKTDITQFNAQSSGGTAPKPPNDDDDKDGGWTRPKGWRLPKNGTWSGARGNSNFKPNNPSQLGLNPNDVVPFVNGKPDFSNWSNGEYEIPGLNGEYENDMPLIYKAIAARMGFENPTAARNWLAAQGLTPNHVEGPSVNLIPRPLHGGIRHMGGAWELRNLEDDEN